MKDYIEEEKNKRQRHQEHNYHRDALAVVLSGETEVEMPSGLRCDVVTNNYAIEVKPVCNYHHAIGQALVYGRELNKKPAVYLFGALTEPVIQCCKDLGVTVINEILDLIKK